MAITLRGAAAATSMMSVLALLGCERGDPRVQALAVGVAKDSAIALMQGKPTASAPYLIDGQYIEAMLYAQPGKTDSASRRPRNMTPLVLVNGKLIGWGWDLWDSVAAAHKIPVESRE